MQGVGETAFQGPLAPLGPCFLSGCSHPELPGRNLGACLEAQTRNEGKWRQKRPSRSPGPC